METTVEAKMTLKNAVIKAFESLLPGEHFHGRAFQFKVAKIYPKAANMYEDTIMRQVRAFCHGKYKCIKAAESLYIKL